MKLAGQKFIGFMLMPGRQGKVATCFKYFFKKLRGRIFFKYAMR